MSTSFTFDKSGLVSFSKQVAIMGKKHRVATAFFLNELAFGSREVAIAETFPRGMQIRNKGFLRRSLLVKRTSTSAPTEAQESIFGSVRVGASTGWIEQQFGRLSKREHVGTLLSRGKNRSRQVQQQARMRRKFKQPEDMQGVFKLAHQRAVVFIEKMKRDGIKEPFFVYGHAKLPNGLYIMRGGGKNKRPMMLQTFDPSQKVKRYKWMTKATGTYMHRQSLDSLWVKTWRKVIK